MPTRSDAHSSSDSFASSERLQIGVKMEKRMIKVLKALAEYHDMTLGDLLESLVLHAFANRLPFDDATLQSVNQLRNVYGVDYDIDAARPLAVSPNVQGKLLS
jgi:hypothetical protein